jgi:predicted RNA-binding protein YlxR (DUF448 family)
LRIVAELRRRMCVITHLEYSEEDLIRFVRGPDGEAIPDLSRRLPGPGIWIALRRDLVTRAIETQLFSREFGKETRADANLPDRLGQLLRKKALSYLAMAKKAGMLTTGFEKVETALSFGSVAILVHAGEASPMGCRKLDCSASSSVVKISVFSVEELNLALGGANVVHAAVTKGGLADKLLATLRQMANYEAHEVGQGIEE